ncbi:MAG: leucine-rich repeat protein [Chitinivibrionia bacterium]|nr:leucine-rich repeat protein [Chitinivibrionia bacterium]
MKGLDFIKNLATTAVVMMAIAAGSYAQTWNCGVNNGSNVTATLSNGTLTISGTGNMNNSYYRLINGTPWYSYNNSIIRIVIDDGVMSIGNNAFSNCARLMTVTIGKDVASIGTDAFYECTYLTSVTSLSEVPPVMTLNAFTSGRANIYATSVTLYVPQTSLSLYGAHPEWKKFGSIKAIGEDGSPIAKTTATKAAASISFAGITTGQINLNLKAEAYTAQLYNLQGRLVKSVDINAINGINATGLRTDNLSKGIFILNVKQAGVSVLKHKIAVK